MEEKREKAGRTICVFSSLLALPALLLFLPISISLKHAVVRSAKKPFAPVHTSKRTHSLVQARAGIDLSRKPASVLD